jgi:glycine/D-amino acid oxidase-like deaminating enzyme
MSTEPSNTIGTTAVQADGAARRDWDIAVVGGGLVGLEIAWGAARLGQRVVVLDEEDAANRASRGNFALVWVQSKGLGMAEYAAWTVASSDAWAGFAAELGEQTGVDVAHERPGGFHLTLSERELEVRANQLKRLHNQVGMIAYETEIMERSRLEAMLPGLGPDVVGGSYCPLDGHVNSLRLYRALLTGLDRSGGRYLAGHRVDGITREGGAFRLRSKAGTVEAGKVVLAAGNANMHLAPMVGLSAPMKPERGQIIVTERTERFLRHPIVTLRQTDEGTVMIGDSREEATDSAGMTQPINTVMADRAVRFFPALARLNVVRTWSAIRVMTGDGFPIYQQSTTHPGAFVVCCHSGVTLAAGHALTLAPMIVAGALEDRLAVFSPARFG